MSQNYKLPIPAGRIVAGSPTFVQTKDPQGRPIEKPRIFFAVAVPKNAPGIEQVMQTIYQTAYYGYQSNAQAIERIQKWIGGGFRWKIDDGDNPEDPKNRGKEGWAGCWIFKFSTTFNSIPCCDSNNRTIDPSMIKCGYFVDMEASIGINGNQDHTAGIYMNPVMVRLVGYGREIISGPLPEQVFANRPVQLPPGASATPLSPAGAMPTQQPMTGGMQPPQQPMAMPPQQPTGGMVPDATQAFTGHAAPLGASAPVAPGFAGQTPAPAPAPAFGGAPSAGTASPSNPYPEAQPHPGILTPGGQ